MPLPTSRNTLSTALPATPISRPFRALNENDAAEETQVDSGHSMEPKNSRPKRALRSRRFQDDIVDDNDDHCGGLTPPPGNHGATTKPSRTRPAPKRIAPKPALRQSASEDDQDTEDISSPLPKKKYPSGPSNGKPLASPKRVPAARKPRYTKKWDPTLVVSDSKSVLANINLTVRKSPSPLMLAPSRQPNQLTIHTRNWSKPTWPGPS
jgi:hypothetical protein